jgi:excisionase family DNA binding protein
VNERLVVNALADALRPVVAELVADEVERQLAERHDDRHDLEYLTTTEYAELHRTTAGAVLARIHRGTLHAIRPPGAREWLIPRSADADGSD